MLTSASDKPIKCVCVTTDLNSDISEEISYSTVLNNICLSEMTNGEVTVGWACTRDECYKPSTDLWMKREKPPDRPKTKTWMYRAHQQVNLQHFSSYAQLMKHRRAEAKYSTCKMRGGGASTAHMIGWFCCTNACLLCRNPQIYYERFTKSKTCQFVYYQGGY